MLIRRATRDDVAAIARLEQEWAASVPTWGYRPRREEELARLHESPCWVAVAEENHEVMAFAVCGEKANDESSAFAAGDRILEVLDLYVSDTHRRTGIGARMLAAIEAEARTAGFTKLYVYSSVVDLNGVLAFYRDAGFDTWSVQLFKILA